MKYYSVLFNYGSIYRFLKECDEPQYFSKIEKFIFEVIKDENLDTYNRLKAYFLFENYIKNSESNERNQNVYKELRLIKKSIKL